MRTIMSFFMVIIIVTGTFAQTIFINSSIGNDVSGDGSSANPYKSFHKGYTMASDGYTLDLSGTFSWTNGGETGDASISGYTISKNISILGHGADQTIVQAAVSESSADRRVFTVALGYLVNFNRLTIRNGNISLDGAGLEIYGEANINYCEISFNHANNGSGGGISVRGSLTIQNSTIHHNTAFDMGGGLLRNYFSGTGGVPSSTDLLDIINCTVTNNRVTQTMSYLEGGGVYFRRGGGSITNSTISFNRVLYGQSSTHGLGTGDASCIVNLKNNIIAENIQTSISQGDIGHISSGNGSFIDNGGNVIGRLGFYIDGYTASSTTWIDQLSSTGIIDGIYILQDGTGVESSPLNMTGPLALNGSTQGTRTLLINLGSCAIGAGSFSSNGTIAIPANDQRAILRSSAPTSGSYEFENTLYTWEGNISNDWNTNENWDLNAIPGIIDHVAIPVVTTFNPTIGNGETADCRDLEIQSGAILTIESGGSIITLGTVSGEALIKRELSDNIWHLISTPVADVLANTFLGDYLQTYTEATNIWTDIIETSTMLNPGQGYALWGISKATSYTFTGTPNSGDISWDYTYTPSGNPDHYGFNLMGNPYPSSINWDLLNETYGAVYYFDGSAYISWNGSGAASQFIPPMQGFMIAPGAAGTLNLENTHRTHVGASNYYKSSGNFENHIVLQVGNQTFQDKLYINFSQEASEGFDLSLDAWKFITNEPKIAQLYSSIGNQKLSIDTRPKCEIIQMGFQCATDGLFDFSIKDMNGINIAILEDTKTRILHNFENGPYEFSHIANEDDSRFILHLNTPDLLTNSLTNKIKIHSNGKTIYISNTGQLANLDVRVFNLLGQIVQKESLGTEINSKFQTKLKQGIYFVSVGDEKVVVTEKVLIQ